MQVCMFQRALLTLSSFSLVIFPHSLLYFSVVLTWIFFKVKGLFIQCYFGVVNQVIQKGIQKNGGIVLQGIKKKMQI